MTKMMMLENDPLTDARDVKLWYYLAMMADIGMISVRVQHRSNRKTNSSKGNLTKTRGTFSQMQCLKIQRKTIKLLKRCLREAFHRGTQRAFYVLIVI